MSVTWPGGRRFAFTAVDDTDWATVQTVKPVYDLLTDLGMRTTKSVWVFNGCDKDGYQGQTCEDEDYRTWALSLQRAGFEICTHNVSPVTSTRARTIDGLARFEELFGSLPRVHCNHRQCHENLYWGDHRVSGSRRVAYRWMTHSRRTGRFRGHIPGDPLFWGDVCRDNVTYVRNFVFDELNTLKVCPEMPYHDPARPYVNFWFASAEGGSLERFLTNFTRDRIDRLVDEGGLCIAYVHFGSGFARDGRLDPEFRKRMEYIASKNGWFAPANTVLDYLRSCGTREQRTIGPLRLACLESRWLARQVRHETASRIRRLAA